MKILLTCTTIEEFHRIETDHDSHYPLGLGYLHSYLESLDKGYEIVTRFLNNVTEEECMKTLKKDLREFKPDVVGISMMTHSRAGAFKFIEYIEETYPDIKIVIGGMHVSVMYRQLADHYKNVVCVVGEGEITLGEILDRWETGTSLADVNGIAFHDGEKVVVTPGRDLIEDLDILPFPKHDLFLWEGKTMAGLLTSRGCPYKCNFCVLDASSRRKVRCRSAANIVDEVEMILKEHPTIHTVWIHDDAFMIIKDRTIEFCKEIIRRGIKTQFVCSARFRPISREVVMLMKEAGFVHVLFGLESGAPNVMKLMRKGLTQKAVRHALKLFSETGIKATAFMIIGLPGETEETINQTIDFLQELQEIHYLYYDDIGVAGIYPGTELFTLAKEAKLEVPGYGVIDDAFWLTGRDVPWYEVENTYETMLRWREKTRNSISLDRIVKTPENFLQQRKLIPQIIQYSWRYGLHGIIAQVMQILNTDQELTMSTLKTVFLDGDQTKHLNAVHSAFEKGLIRTLFQSMDLEQKNAFKKAYEVQIVEDRKTIARWHKTQTRENSGVETNKNHKHSEAVVNNDGTMVNPIDDGGFDDDRKRKVSKQRLNVIQ